MRNLKRIIAMILMVALLFTGLDVTVFASDFELPNLDSSKLDSSETDVSFVDETDLGILEIDESGLDESNLATYSLYSSDSDEAIEIYTAEQLNEVRNDLSGDYRLMANIDLGGVDWMPIGTTSTPFMGTFDGNGYTISNLTVNVSEDNAGLFGINNGRIQNVSLENASINGGNYVGALAGINKGFIMDSAVSVSEVKGVAYVGGLVGSSQGGLIEQSYATGNANATNGAGCGGFIGKSGSNDKIKNCYSLGNVSSGHNTGGLQEVCQGVS